MCCCFLWEFLFLFAEGISPFRMAMYIIRLNFFYRDLQMTLIVLFLFRVVSVFFFHLLYLKIESFYVIFMQKKNF